MSDHVDRAAEVIYVEVLGLPDYSPDAVDDHNRHSYRGDCQCNASDRVDARHAAEALDAAGLLTTPEHDAAVAARALRVVESVCMDTDGDHLDGDAEIPVGEVMRMICEAEERFGVEREGGASS